jgi:hypothetical protein
MIKKTTLFSNRAVGTETTLKSGVSAERPGRSRRNLLFFSLIATVALSICFSSCKKDDDGDSDNSIVGLYHFVNVTADIQNPANPEFAESKKSMMLLGTVFMQGSTVEFKADGTLVFTVMGESETGTYATKDGFKITSMEGDDDVLTPGSSVTLKDGVLTIVYNMLDDLDEDFDAEGDKTYREEGFTKYEQKMVFKK